MIAYWLIGMVLEILWTVRTILKCKNVNPECRVNWLNVFITIFELAGKAWIWPLLFSLECYTIIHENDDTYKL